MHTANDMRSYTYMYISNRNLQKNKLVSNFEYKYLSIIYLVFTLLLYYIVYFSS